jgi:hypothetical protein
VTIVRSVVVMPDHVVDRLAWRADAACAVTLPLPVRVRDDDEWAPWDGAPARLQAFLAQVRARPLVGGGRWHAIAHGVVAPGRARDTAAPGGDPTAFALTIASREPALLWRAATPGPPGGAPHATLALRQEGTEGMHWRVLAEPGALRDVMLDGDTLVVDARDGTVHRHERVAHGWLVSLAAGGARSSIDLGGVRADAEHAVTAALAQAARAADGAKADDDATSPAARVPIELALGESHWRRGDRSWRDDGAPSAVARVAATSHAVVLTLDIALGRPVALVPRVAENPLDNEHPDTNADGVQLHFVEPDGDAWCGALVVPEPGGVVRMHRTGSATRALAASWTPIEGGWRIVLELDWDRVRAPRITLDACINVRPPDRERRCGQLVLGGGRGEWVYLRGDRQPRDHARVFSLDPVRS